MRDYISASFIEDWLKCPYKAAHVREIPLDTSNQFTDLGVLVHRTLDRYYESDATIEEIYEEEAAKIKMPNLKMYGEGLKMLKNFELSEACSESDILAREKEFDIDLEPDKEDDSPHCRIKGVIDRIDYLGNGVYEIIDYKTSMYVKDKYEIENDLQMAIYELVFSDLWNTGVFFDSSTYPSPNKIILTIHYLRYGKWRLPPISEGRREALRKYLINIFKQVNSDQQVQKVNKYCVYCPFRNECAAFESVMTWSPSAIKFNTMSTDEILEYYDKLRVSKGLIDKHMDEVKDVINDMLLETEEGIETPKYVATASTKRYKVRDADDVRKILEPLGMFEQVISVDNRKLDKLAKDNNLEREVDSITTYNFSKPTLSIKEKHNILGE